MLCCHPAVTPASQVALTLRAVGGLTTAEIAAAYLVPEATMAPRISRAKQQIRAAGARFELPHAPQRSERLAIVLQVLYLVFNEGYAASSGENLMRSDLAAEAIRLARMLHRLLPDDSEVAGLLALMLLTDARRAARTGRGRRAGAARQAGPLPLGRRADQGGERHGRCGARQPTGGALPAASRDRGAARRGARSRGHRLAADRRPVRRP
jgi:hypothetical protein